MARTICKSTARLTAMSRKYTSPNTAWTFAPMFKPATHDNTPETMPRLMANIQVNPIRRLSYKISFVDAKPRNIDIKIAVTIR